jgi:hypothetical protein
MQQKTIKILEEMILCILVRESKENSAAANILHEYTSELEAFDKTNNLTIVLETLEGDEDE